MREAILTLDFRTAWEIASASFSVAIIVASISLFLTTLIKNLPEIASFIRSLSDMSLQHKKLMIGARNHLAELELQKKALELQIVKAGKEIADLADRQEYQQEGNRRVSTKGPPAPNRRGVNERR